MALERIEIEPTVLAWARRSSGRSDESAANSLGVRVDTLRRWESGDLHPTIGQLRRAAKLYRRPLAVLLLPAAPADFDALRDFRSGEHAGDWSSALHAEYKRALSQRDVILEIADFAPSAATPDSFDVEVALPANPEELAEAIRRALGVTQLSWTDPRDALNAWVAAVEDAGIIVVQITGVDVDEMRGFSVSDQPRRLIALNGSDSPRGRLFTLGHELAHLASNAGGICLLDEPRRVETLDERVEHFCNAVAASLLMPRSMLLEIAAVATASRDKQWTLDELWALARRFGTSSEAMLLRLVGLDKATWETYWLRKPEFDAEYARARGAERERQRESEGGPSYYVVKARNLGHRYVRTVLDAFRSRAITSLDLADYLDVRFEQVTKLEEVVH